MKPVYDQTDLEQGLRDDALLDRIKAHRSAPDVYDPPTFDQMAERIFELEDKLKGLMIP